MINDQSSRFDHCGVRSNRYACCGTEWTVLQVSIRRMGFSNSAGSSQSAAGPTAYCLIESSFQRVVFAHLAIGFFVKSNTAAGLACAQLKTMCKCRVPDSVAML